MPENVKDNPVLRATIIEHLQKRLHNCELSNLDVLKIIEGLCVYGNCCTISEYARREKITYNGALDRISSGKVKVLEFFGERFIIENE